MLDISLLFVLVNFDRIIYRLAWRSGTCMVYVHPAIGQFRKRLAAIIAVNMTVLHCS